MHPASSDPQTAGPGESRWQGTGTVLVVDDEAAVRQTAAQMIAFFGFEVQEAESGPRALEILGNGPRAFDLVLLDLTMPVMDGFATFTAIREMRPDQPVVVFSGYSAQDAKRRFEGRNLNGFLQKPFSIQSLREILQPFSRK
jgi:CheY-like chemotaxis protein